MKLELYYFPGCPYCYKVLSKIKELKLESISYKNIMEDSQAMEKLIGDTGRRTVPCLYIDNSPMHESSDIVQWLEKNKAALS